MAPAAKGNMVGLNACCTRWEISVFTGGTGWTVENSAAVGRAHEWSLGLTSRLEKLMSKWSNLYQD